MKKSWGLVRCLATSGISSGGKNNEDAVGGVKNNEDAMVGVGIY